MRDCLAEQDGGSVILPLANSVSLVSSTQRLSYLSGKLCGARELVGQWVEEQKQMSS